uniref:DDE Tnp4 domain-containing protein n=1 Tax=Plectus sambesii TaxID=2011161 RepID=A0A914V4L2_9BILA
MTPFRENHRRRVYLSFLAGASHWLRMRERQRKRATRRWWVHPIGQLRQTVGEFHHLYRQLRQYPDKFYEYFRMSPASFDLLLSKLSPQLRKTSMRPAISTEERLVVTLRYLATGQSFRALGFSFRIAYSTISLIVRECCEAIWTVLKDEYMRCPSTPAEWQSIAQELWEKTKFPNCLGCLDGKHCMLKKPKKSGALYYNYKGTFSIVLLALCDARYRFLFVDIGSFGHNNDAGIYDSSALGAALEMGALNIPPPSTLPGTELLTPYVVVGDGAFPLKPYLMKPFSGQNLSTEKDVFNYRLSRCRRLIENTFGICSSMWRILLKPIETSIKSADASIRAVCALHNFLIAEENTDFSPARMADRDEDDNGVWRTQLATLRQPNHIRPPRAHNSSLIAKNVRANFQAFFQGSVEQSFPKQTPLCSLHSTCKLLSLRDRNLLQSKMQKVILCILLLTVLSIAVPSVSAACKKVGPDNVKIDRACSRGESLGCNAGGQGQNCRFCGKEGLPRC